MGIKVRILTAFTLDGIDYHPNQVVDFPVATAKAQEAAGTVDAHKEAVSYCVNDLGAVVVIHKIKTTASGDEKPAVTK
ncbi:hypothetical protein [Pseudomonas sp.]|uniref:hypothetical protein n=1 Tax=Pseudomonas sp. TaxID=306 RepID=UPI003F38D1AB